MILGKTERRTTLSCSSEEAENRVNDLFLTFNFPANKKFAQELKNLFIKYDKETYLRALKIFMLEIYPKHLPKLGMLKQHLEQANKDTQNKRNMEKIKTTVLNDNDRSEWRKFIKMVMTAWGDMSSKNMSTDDYNQQMANYFELNKDFEGRDAHLKLIKEKKNG